MMVGLAAITVGCGKDDAPAKKAGKADEAKPASEPEAPPKPTKPSVVSEEVTYQVGDKTFRGYLATLSGSTEKRPGVIVVHQWWGHDDYARSRARQLAEMGYTALAVDMYGDGKQADHPKTAMAFSTEAMKDKDVMAARFDAALEILKKHDSTDPEKMAAIGYCFGGAVVLEMAKRGSDLDAIASFHGTLSTDTPVAKGTVKGQVFVAHGAADPFVKPETLEAFKKQMKDAAVPMTFEAYEGAKHSFTDPRADELGKKFELPLEYNKAADARSWETLTAMLTEVFDT